MKILSERKSLNILGGIVIAVIVLSVGIMRFIELQRNREIQAIRDEISEFDRATEDHEYDAANKMKACVEQNHLMDLQEQRVGKQVGPLAQAKLAAKDFGERCSVGMQEIFNDTWKRFNRLARRDLEDKLRNAELGRKPSDQKTSEAKTSK